MSSDRKPTKAVSTRRADGRYLRWSHRYNTFQLLTRHNTWVNINVQMARSYSAAGFPLGVHGGARYQEMEPYYAQND